MKFLLLNGHGIDIRINDAKLHIKDGFYSLEQEAEEFVFSPRRINVNSIIVYGRNGNITIDAVRWLVKHNVNVAFLDWNGKLLTSILPPENANAKLKLNQYRTYENKEKRVELAKKFIEAKFERTQEVLNWLNKRYPKIKTDFEVEKKKLQIVEKIPSILLIEGKVASFYWKQLRKVIPEKYEFKVRGASNKRSQNAGDTINCLLNYGYAILEAECLKVINSVGLDAYLGFMHEKASGKNSLAYDLQEPYRFLIDLAVISAIENNIFTKKDFIRTENYYLKLRPTGAKKLLKEIEIQFNKRNEFKGKQSTWNYIIFNKVRELANFIENKRKSLDFSEPSVELNRIDSQEIRQKILAIPYSKAKNYGFSKGTLHYMKQNAKSKKPFKIYEPVKEKLSEICQ